jgi:iron complex outermembrane recepter protein
MKTFARATICFSIASALCGTTQSAWADDDLPALKTITVQGTAQKRQQVLAKGAEQGETIQGNGLKIMGGPGQTNPYKAISMLPSVVTENPDPYGLANMPGGNKGLRIRGESSPHGGIGAVEGLPITGIDPGPGSQFLIDMENVRQITLLRPPFAPDHLAISPTDGYLNSELLWPKAQAGGTFSQSLGTDGFRRSFLRLDSGELSTGTRIFASGSYTHANQWRGPGESPDYRYNGEFGISQTFNQAWSAKFFAVFNSTKADNYAPLSYAQATDLSRYNEFGYNSSLTGIPGQDVNYYGFNRQNFHNHAFIAELKWQPNPDESLVIKPFYNKESGYYLIGKPKIGGPQPGVLQWDIDHANYGLVAQYDKQLNDTHLTAGYWFEDMAPPGPPTAWKFYRITPNGGLNFGGWALLADTTADHVFNSPFVKLSHDFGPLKVTGGLRYFMEQSPSINTYNTRGIGDVPYDTALAEATAINPARSVTGKTFHQWQPYLGLVYTFSPTLTANFAYGRNNGSPAFNNWPQVQMNFAAFQHAGLTIQDAWNTLKPEQSDAFSTGLNIHHRHWYVRPTLFFATYHDKGVSVYDPEVNISYPQNAGRGQAWGAELAAGVEPLPELSLFTSLAYNRAHFTQNLQVMSGSVLPVDGLQFPDTPRFIGSAGATYHYGRIAISPTVQYLSTRYADSLHTQPLPGYFLANLNIGYQRHVHGLGTLNMGLSVLNLFNRKYISLIDTSYLQTSGTSFYPGAPRTVAGTVTLSF